MKIYNEQEKKENARMHSIAHLNIKVNQIKSLFRTFCSLLNQHTLDSMIIQVISQEIHLLTHCVTVSHGWTQHYLKMCMNTACITINF